MIKAPDFTLSAIWPKGFKEGIQYTIYQNYDNPKMKYQQYVLWNQCFLKDLKNNRSSSNHPYEDVPKMKIIPIGRFSQIWL